MTETLVAVEATETRVETAEFLIETRRIGTGPNGVILPNLPTDWWAFGTLDTLAEAMAMKAALAKRALIDGDTFMGREFRLVATRSVLIETTEIY